MKLTISRTLSLSCKTALLVVITCLSGIVVTTVLADEGIENPVVRLGDYSSPGRSMKRMGGRFALMDEFLSNRGMRLDILKIPVQRFGEQLEKGAIDIAIPSLVSV